MKIAIWNVNSIKARGDHVVQWLTARQPDVLMVQELKGEQVDPAPFNAIGYDLHVNGQKAYNGVATLTKTPLEVISNQILEGDEQARYLETRTEDGPPPDQYLRPQRQTGRQRKIPL